MLRRAALLGLALGWAAAAHATTGCVTDQNSVTLDSSATLDIAIGGTTACSSYDQYNVSQALTLLGPTLDVTLINGFQPAQGNTFKILSWGSLAGTFGKLTLPPLGVGLEWDTSQLYVTGTLAVTAQSSSDGPLPLWSVVLLGVTLCVIAGRRSWPRRPAAG